MYGLFARGLFISFRHFCNKDTCVAYVIFCNNNEIIHQKLSILIFEDYSHLNILKGPGVMFLGSKFPEISSVIYLVAGRNL